MTSLSLETTAGRADAPTPDPEPRPGPAHPIDGAIPSEPTDRAESPDRTKEKWCHCCKSPRPPEGWKNDRCARCNSGERLSGKTRILFDAAGNIVTDPKLALYDAEGRLNKKVARKKK